MCYKIYALNKKPFLKSLQNVSKGKHKHQSDQSVKFLQLVQDFKNMLFRSISEKCLRNDTIY